MSDLSISLEALERSRSQLSVHSYFDEDLFRKEQSLIFDAGPRYLGHELAVPEVGDYQAWPRKAKAVRWCARLPAWS
jgi:choline monooxygenase